jgi:hypothetical protein
MSNDFNPDMPNDPVWLHVSSWAFANPGIASRPATANNVAALTLSIALLLTDSAMTKLPLNRSYSQRRGRAEWFREHRPPMPV